MTNDDFFADLEGAIAHLEADETPSFAAAVRLARAFAEDALLAVAADQRRERREAEAEHAEDRLRSEQIFRYALAADPNRGELPLGEA